MQQSRKSDQTSQRVTHFELTIRAPCLSTIPLFIANPTSPTPEPICKTLLLIQNDSIIFSKGGVIRDNSKIGIGQSDTPSNMELRIPRTNRAYINIMEPPCS